MTHLTYAEAMVVGLIQGVTELFPVSSLGHNVLIPALIGGSWAQDLNVSKPESPYLAFIVGLHVATALAMIIYFWRDWLRIVGGFFSSLRDRQISTADQRLAWLIITATIPVGIAEFGTVFTVPYGTIFAASVVAVTSAATSKAVSVTWRPRSVSATARRRRSFGSASTVTAPRAPSRSTTPLMVAASRQISRPSWFCEQGPTS